MKSRVSVLGTIGELHLEPVGFDLAVLTRIVREARPDLLCAEIHPYDWATHERDRLPPEYRDALLPLSRRTDIVVVPVSGYGRMDLAQPRKGPFLAMRTFLVRLLNAHLRWMQSGKRGVKALNSGTWGTVCDRLCSLTARLCGRDVLDAWDEANRTLFENVLEAIRRDPGRRVLVTVDCRRRHRLERELRRVTEVDLLPYEKL